MPTGQSRLLEMCADLMQAKGIDRYYVDAVREIVPFFENGTPIMPSKPTKNIKLKTDKTGKVKVETTASLKRSKSQQIAARKSPKQKVVRRTAG